MILFFDQIIDRPNNKSINIQLYKIELSQNLSGKIIQKNIIIIYNSYNIKYDKILDFYRFFKKSDSLQIFSTIEFFTRTFPRFYSQKVLHSKYSHFLEKSLSKS